MPRSSPTGRRTGRPAVTSTRAILDAARGLIERDGVDRLTVRRLAAEMEIGTTTLYHHVQGREDLLVLLLDEYLGAVPRPALPTAPRERAVAAARVMRDALLACPWVAEVLTTDGFLGMLSDASVWVVDVILGAAIDGGCSEEEAVWLFRNIWYFTVGQILVLAHSQDATPEERAQRAGFAGRDPEALPHLASIGARWPSIAVRDTFEDGIRALVEAGIIDARS
ncbi:AcrR family transcriptional regulator [Microbacterium ginsengiterrae]|uniref:AcrR family transcriptional regulator n=1 Tax=Microbacterium ginsengiterrae TaxID=546115 RepID=A0A7W9CCP2_9MICO|nr:TetR/AcrR family transcriptional regulator [Microbacterium ginsengiterrae]MBB5743149.1 AcrR family transcriptional regulator [Microbacterium ginsengiterrae]